LTVTIDDDGPGIPLQMREEVFKPFLRLDDARNQDEGGTGLGLAIARDIARSHGGDIILATVRRAAFAPRCGSRCSGGASPRPFCGERVGVRGCFPRFRVQYFVRSGRSLAPYGTQRHAKET